MEPFTCVEALGMPWFRLALSLCAGVPLVDPLFISYVEVFPWWNPIPIKGRYALVQVDPLPM